MNFLHLMVTLLFERYSPDNILKVKVTMARLKVRYSSHHDAAHLNPSTNVPTVYQLSAPYSHLKDYEIWPGQDFKDPSHYGKVTLRTHHAHLNPSTNALLCINLLHLMVTLWIMRYNPDKTSKINLTAARSEIELRSHHDAAHGFRNIVQTRFLNSGSL